MKNQNRRQVSVRLDNEIVEKLMNHARTNGSSVTEILRNLMTPALHEYLNSIGKKSDNPTSTTTDLDQAEIKIQKEPPTVVPAEPIKQVKRKEVEPEIQPSESLVHEEEEKPKGILQRFQDWCDSVLFTID